MLVKKSVVDNDILKNSVVFTRSLLSNDNTFFSDERSRLLQIVNNSDIKIKGKNIPVSFIPLIFSYKDMSYLARLINSLYAIFDKITRHYIRDEEYRKLFRLDPALEELILLPHYEDTCIVPVGRIDMFLTSDGFKICELNTDGTGGMSRSDFVDLQIVNNKITRGLYPNSFSLKVVDNITFEFDKYIKKIIKQKSNGDVHISVVDFRKEGVFSDFNAFIKAFNKLGYKARFTDIEDLYFDGEKLIDKIDNEVVDVIYRRAVSSVVAANMDKCKDLIEAVKQKKVFLIGDFRSTLVHSKSISVGVFFEETQKLLTDDEKILVEKLFPKSYFLDEKLLEEKLSDFQNNKSKWIIKPQEGFASKGVITGRELTRAKWAETLKECSEKNYIIQEFIESKKFPALALDSDEIESMPVLIGIYHCLNNFVGMYNRAGNDGIIDFEHKGLLYPSFCSGEF